MKIFAKIIIALVLAFTFVQSSYGATKCRSENSRYKKARNAPKKYTRQINSAQKKLANIAKSVKNENNRYTLKKIRLAERLASLSSKRLSSFFKGDPFSIIRQIDSLKRRIDSMNRTHDRKIESLNASRDRYTQKLEDAQNLLIEANAEFDAAKTAYDTCMANS